jgi:hypothetical protein
VDAHSGNNVGMFVCQHKRLTAMVQVNSWYHNPLHTHCARPTQHGKAILVEGRSV